jgi:hypothetical protein
MGHVSQIGFDGAAALASARCSQLRCSCSSGGGATIYNADAPPQVTQEGEMTEFLAQMPTDTMIFLTMAVLGLATMLIVLRLI